MPAGGVKLNPFTPLALRSGLNPPPSKHFVVACTRANRRQMAAWLALGLVCGLSHATTEMVVHEEDGFEHPNMHFDGFVSLRLRAAAASPAC